MGKVRSDILYSFIMSFCQAFSVRSGLNPCAEKVFLIMVDALVNALETTVEGWDKFRSLLHIDDLDFGAGGTEATPPSGTVPPRRSRPLFDSNTKGLTDKPLSCPHSHGSVRTVKAYPLHHSILYMGSQANLTCKSWSCPVCRERNVKRLWRRIYEGLLMKEAERLCSLGIKNAIKLLTLTCPGEDYRSTHSADEALDDLWRYWAKLRKAIQARYGDYHFFAMIEMQKDGTPHLHVVLVGESITPYSLREYIERLWRYKYFKAYDGGFIKLRSRVKMWDNSSRSYELVHLNDAKKAIGYVVKYLTKNPPMVANRRRIYNSSHGALGNDISTDNGLTLYTQISSDTIQRSDAEYPLDYKELFSVNNSVDLKAAMNKHFEPDNPILKGRIKDYDDYVYLKGEYPGADLPDYAKRVKRHCSICGELWEDCHCPLPERV